MFALFIFGYESYTNENQRNTVEAYAGVISNSLWHFEPQAPIDYLTLIVAEQDYERFRVVTSDGFDFVDVQSNQISALEKALIALKLIHQVEITTDIKYQSEIIGEITAIWLNKNIYLYFYVLIVIVLSMGVFGLYRRILQSNRQLEIGVQERTVELHNANLELKESEARYRSIFEDSPISLREEDFSEAKKIIDKLRSSGVKDFRNYFDQHPETVAECMRRVKVLNVNQNTLELFKTDDKERLYKGLTDIFIEESLVSFGQQLTAFAEGNTYFDAETIQQTVTGEKLWAGTRVAIAPGYEGTWAKIFVSIVDITNRKETEAELAKYHEQLEDLIADRTRDLSVLYDVTAIASKVLDLDELLSRLLERSLSAMRCKAGIIQLTDETTSMLRLNSQQGVSENISDEIAAFFANQGNLNTFFKEHSYYTSSDLGSDSRILQSLCQSGWCAYIGVPIQDTRREILGVLSIFSEAEYPLSVEELTLLTSIADHIGLAVENFRLRQQAEEIAVLEDRQRLARELHDAVNQSLFSASVIAETLPRLMDRDQLLVQQNLGDLHRLIRGALAEMRILLLELRPVSMADAVLEDLLHQLVDSIKGRTQLDISLHIQGKRNIPTIVKKNLFRITQEALHNVVKHARAEHVELVLNQRVDQIMLSIYDDGQGFEPSNVDGGHLGLQIMQERADNIGAILTVASQPLGGTKIVTIWFDPDEKT